MIWRAASIDVESIIPQTPRGGQPVVPGVRHVRHRGARAARRARRPQARAPPHPVRHARARQGG